MTTNNEKLLPREQTGVSGAMLVRRSSLRKVSLGRLPGLPCDRMRAKKCRTLNQNPKSPDQICMHTRHWTGKHKKPQDLRKLPSPLLPLSVSKTFRCPPEGSAATWHCPARNASPATGFSGQEMRVYEITTYYEASRNPTV